MLDICRLCFIVRNPCIMFNARRALVTIRGHCYEATNITVRNCGGFNVCKQSNSAGPTPFRTVGNHALAEAYVIIICAN